MAAPEPFVEISQMEKSFQGPPHLSSNDRKTLPQLPTLDEVSSTYENDKRSTVSANASNRTLTPAPGGPDKPLPLPFGITLDPSGQPRPPTRDGVSRPMTASTKRLSLSSINEKRRIKYGTGKYAMVELSPQPSDDSEDPLNWPLWKKHLNFLSLLFMAALVGVMKTAFISVNASVARMDGVSYTAAVGVTGVPLILSAVVGLISTVIARIWGKRPVYLVATLFLFIGVIWNTSVGTDLAQTMAARIFQAIGWGAFDVLVLDSIQDTYFEHERQPIIVIYYAVTVATTWGSPLLGGVASNGPKGFEVQFQILAAFMAIAVPLLILGAPETAYDRSCSLSLSSPASSAPMNPGTGPRWPVMTLSWPAVLDYILHLDIWCYRTNHPINGALLTQAPRAFAAPSTLLLFAATFLPHAALWGFASSLSQLFSTMPFRLEAADLGALMTGPFLLALPLAVGATLFFRRYGFTRTWHVAALALGALLAFVGILGFGLHIDTAMAGGPAAAMWHIRSNHALSLPAVSFLLGLLAAGATVLDSTMRPVVQRSAAAATAANVPRGLRLQADMHVALTCLRSVVAGVFVLGVPNATAWGGLRATAIGVAVTQLLLVAAVASAWWFAGETVTRWDVMVSGVESEGLRRTASYFDTD
ncbi:hypothetical protein F4780DRAFT_634595 [Xylariomycetidae sp. FL0641]|nr:hypothetical protein F4780DRAFT_634595 [Xylariomycetidae sp. FL0641]